jgi:hypothetical protein
MMMMMIDDDDDDLDDDDEDDDDGMLGIYTRIPNSFSKYGNGFAPACLEWRHTWT